MLACRACRIPMTATAGCAVCDPMRRNLVVVGEEEDERPSLSGTASEVVSVLRARVSHTRQALQANPDDLDAERRVLQLGNTLAKVLESARKLTQDGLALVENLSFAERKELMVQWYTDLAPAYRSVVREAMTQYEADVSKPLPTPIEELLS